MKRKHGFLEQNAGISTERPCAGCPQKLCCAFSSMDEQTFKFAKEIRTLVIGYSGDQYIFNRGEPTTGLHVLCKGAVALTTNSPDSTDLILELLGVGDFLDLEDVLLKNPRHTISAKALGDSLVSYVGAEVLLTSIRADALASQRLFNRHLKRCSVARRRIPLFLTSDGITRMCVVFSELLRISELSSSKSNTLIPFHLPRALLSELTYLAEETVSRLLTKMERNKLIKRLGPQIKILNADSIHKIARPIVRLEGCNNDLLKEL